MSEHKRERNLVAMIEEAKQYFTTLSVDFVTADEIGVTYEMMPGTRPQDSGALVAIWQNANEIPWDNEPISTQPIGSQQRGSLSFTGLTVQANQYTIGLSVGPLKTEPQKARNVVASAYIPNDRDPPELANDFLTLKHIGINSVAVQFNALAGWAARTNGAWLGIWRGSSASYFKRPDDAVAIKIDADFGTVSFNNFPIGVGLTYTIGLFSSGWADDPLQRNQKTLCTSLTFTQGQGRVG